MEISAQKLAKLLAAPAAGVRASSLVVAGELGVKAPDVVAAVTKLLDDPAGFVRIEAVRTAGKLKLDKSLPTLLERIAHGGAEGEASAHAAAAMGAKGVKALQELLHKVAPGVRKYIAAALALTGLGSSDAAAIGVFLEPDVHTAEAAEHALGSNIVDMTDAKKKELATNLVKLASSKKPPLPKVSEGPVFRLLSALNVPSTASFFWDRTQAPYSPDVRAIAIQTVGGWIKSPTPEQWKRLFACAVDSEFRVVSPALLILEKLPYSSKQLNDWIKLFQAPDVAARRLAVNKLGGENSAAIANGLMAQMTHHDRSLKESARAKLVSTDAGRKAMVDSLIHAENQEDAWALARTAAGSADSFSTKVKQDLLESAGERIESGSHLADPILFLLKEADPTLLRDGLFEKAVELRKKKKYEPALAYLKLLGRDPSAGFAVRFELACVGLKMSKKELGREYRINDACLSQFAHTANADSAETVKLLEKAKWLEPEELFYVGFHFAEDLGKLREFGAECLKICIARSPKGKVAQNAKTKLKTIAL
ncbi:MAG: HEAT repeat domain-containing protein [Gemmataceae bacterium]